MPRREIIIPIGPSIAYIPLTKGLFALIDSQDVEEVGKHSWSAHTSRHAGRIYTSYAATAIKDIHGKYRYKALHAFIVQTQSGQHTDHRNGNGLDCRRANLRSCTPGQNQCNYRLRSLNTSGFRGVWPSNNGRWQSAIKINKQTFHLGTFDTAEEAAKAYRLAAASRHGEFAHRL